MPPLSFRKKMAPSAINWAICSGSSVVCFVMAESFVCESQGGRRGLLCAEFSDELSGGDVLIFEVTCNVGKEEENEKEEEEEKKGKRMEGGVRM